MMNNRNIKRGIFHGTVEKSKNTKKALMLPKIKDQECYNNNYWFKQIFFSKYLIRSIVCFSRLSVKYAIFSTAKYINHKLFFRV